MSRFYRRKEPGPAENLRAGLVAGGIAATVAAVSFYLARVFMSREWLEPLDPSGAEEDPETRTRGGGN
jgi:hypothetical protein